MTQILVAALMWVLVVSLLIVRRKRADRSITYASITIAVAMTLNVDAVYAAIDPVLGGTNIATLIADGCGQFNATGGPGAGPGRAGWSA